MIGPTYTISEIYTNFYYVINQRLQKKIVL